MRNPLPTLKQNLPTRTCSEDTATFVSLCTLAFQPLVLGCVQLPVLFAGHPYAVRFIASSVKTHCTCGAQTCRSDGMIGMAALLIHQLLPNSLLLLFSAFSQQLLMLSGHNVSGRFSQTSPATKKEIVQAVNPRAKTTTNSESNVPVHSRALVGVMHILSRTNVLIW